MHRGPPHRQAKPATGPVGPAKLQPAGSAVRFAAAPQVSLLLRSSGPRGPQPKGQRGALLPCFAHAALLQTRPFPPMLRPNGHARPWYLHPTFPVRFRLPVLRRALQPVARARLDCCCLRPWRPSGLHHVLQWLSQAARARLPYPLIARSTGFPPPCALPRRRRADHEYRPGPDLTRQAVPPAQSCELPVQPPPHPTQSARPVRFQALPATHSPTRPAPAVPVLRHLIPYAIAPLLPCARPAHPRRPATGPQASQPRRICRPAQTAPAPIAPQDLRPPRHHLRR